MRIFKVTILTIICIGLPFYCNAVDVLEPCDKVIIAGDSGWEPYVKVGDAGITGIGIELAEKLFSDLDIPVVSVAFDNRLELLKALRTGDIDLVVSTYPNNDVAVLTDLVQPDYRYDPISVIVTRDNLPRVNTWEDLGGQHGVMEMTFAPDQETQDFFINYLSINDKLSMESALEAVLSGRAYYIVGSELQLRYAIEANELQSTLAVASSVRRPASVYMAFLKGSPCKQYATFMTKRLQEYKSNGTVEKIENQYIVRQ